jgi:hypothetical protein
MSYILNSSMQKHKLKDLKNYNVPIEKAIKHFKAGKSDWDAALDF